MTNLEKLKRDLFEATGNSLMRWHRLMYIGWDEYGVKGQKAPEWLWNSIEKENAKSRELLAVIRDCGLKDEFDAWFEKKKAMG